MAKDVIITPASGLVNFKDTSGNSDATIQLDDLGNLNITNPGGSLSIGESASNLYIGDGTNSVDIIFEQSGKVRALTNKTLTLGQSDSYVTTASPFGFLSPDGTKQITARMLNTDVLSFQGNAGELLSLSDSFSGTIFSVNDVSGIPSIEVLDTGVVKLAQYSGNVGIGDAAPAQKLSVTGNIAATGQINATTLITSGYVSSVNPTGVGFVQGVGGSVSSWYNAFIRNDGANVYFLSSAVQTTAAAATNATWNAFRPFQWNVGTGAVIVDSTGIGASFGGNIAPTVTNTKTLGTASLLWNNVYATTFTGALSGNAATATSATNLYGAGGSYIASSSNGTGYSAAIQIRESALGGAQASAMAAAPRLAFHWSGLIASSIAIEANGRIGIFNNPGTSYEALVCAGLQCNQVSSQASDAGYVVRSYNTTASGASQFYVKHNLAAVEVGNDRGAISFLGNASTATTLATARNINGVSFNGSADITVTAAAGTLTGATLASGVTASSLTSVGTLTSLIASGAITGSAFVPSGSSVPSNGMYLSAANTLNWSTATTLAMTLSSAGALTVVGEITAFSDSSLKANIEIIADALNKVEAIRGVTYTRTDSDDKQKRHTGVIAQEIEAVLPEAVLVNEDGIRSVAYGNMVGLLIEAVKELSSQNKALLARLEVLEAKE